MKKMITAALVLALLTACQGRPAPPPANSQAAASVTSETVSSEAASSEAVSSEAASSEAAVSSEAVSSETADKAAELSVSAVLTGKTVLTGTLSAGGTSDAALALAEDGLLSESQTILGFGQDGKLSVHMGGFTYLDETQAAAQYEAFLEEGTSAQLSGSVVTVLYSQSPFVDMTAEQAEEELAKNGYACQIEPIS